MSEEEKIKMAIDFAKQGIDLEDVEKNGRQRYIKI